jgi:hypothetical protein
MHKFATKYVKNMQKMQSKYANYIKAIEYITRS